MIIRNPKKLSDVKKENLAKKAEKESIGRIPFIEEDVVDVATATAYILEDASSIGEAVAYLLEEIENLKGGN